VIRKSGAPRQPGGFPRRCEWSCAAPRLPAPFDGPSNARQDELVRAVSGDQREQPRPPDPRPQAGHQEAECGIGVEILRRRRPRGVERGATILRPGAERTENTERRTEDLGETSPAWRPSRRRRPGPLFFFALRSFSAAVRVPFRESVACPPLRNGSGRGRRTAAARARSGRCPPRESGLSLTSRPGPSTPVHRAWASEAIRRSKSRTPSPG
jgi:hypothetical protein